MGGTTTYYLLDDRNPSGYVQVLEEWTVTSTATNLARVYNYGLALISQRVPNSSTNYFVFDGHGSTRALMDIGGNVVNTFAYDAYGTLIASNGLPQTAYLYCGQQFDSDLGLYLNRARYLNTGTGRFWTMDTYEGDNEDPLSLHKYLYCEVDPIDGVDPTGHEMSWESYMGYEAEKTIDDEYAATHRGDDVYYGARQSGFSLKRYLKPDIFNKSNHKLLEIKPISAGGVQDGPLAIGKDIALFGPFGYSPEVAWQPRSCILETDDDGPIFVINVGGIVYYKSTDELKWQLIAVGSIKAASDLLPYLRLSISDLAPLVARIRVLSIGIMTYNEADMEDGINIASETALMGAP